jgi:hypothetical protein
MAVLGENRSAVVFRFVAVSSDDVVPAWSAGSQVYTEVSGAHPAGLDALHRFSHLTEDLQR